MEAPASVPTPAAELPGSTAGEGKDEPISSSVDEIGTQLQSARPLCGLVQLQLMDWDEGAEYCGDVISPSAPQRVVDDCYLEFFYITPRDV